MKIKSKYGRWNTSSESARKLGKLYWLCTCDCGTVRHVSQYSLTAGLSKSCGCIKNERIAALNKSHGKSRTKEHWIWSSMRQRCNSPSDASYERYGGRGIRVCKEWDSFEQFMADMGERPSTKHSIERIDNNGDYCPDNCTWATNIVQQRNTRRNRMITFNGETRCMAEWAELYGMTPDALKNRIYRGWSIERALTESFRVGKNQYS